VAMAKAFVVPAIVRRRGNPNWGKPTQRAPILATEFEKQVQRLGLTKQTCKESGPLRYWCERNKNRCYIPEWLLGAWGIDVDATFSGETPLPHLK
jgi:hypothetical protein